MNGLNWRVAWVLFVATLAGCSGKSANPQQMLPGKWGGDMSAAAVGSRAAELKSQNPSASGSEAIAGAKNLGMIALELREDGTVTAVNQTVTYEGKWTFDAAKSQVEFDLAQTSPAVPDDKKSKTIWIANVDSGNQSLELFMGDRAALDFLKEVNKGKKDGLIILKKK
ncbi:MAG: hypothetical protein U0894_04140 [Pirellulales bacterium]